MQVKELLSKVMIDDLYTRLTGQEFSRVNGALRALNTFRGDSNPSMTLRKRSNTLADYAEGKHYNHFDILKLTGVATTYAEQLQYLAVLSGTHISEDDLSAWKKNGEVREALELFKVASVKALEDRFSGPAFQKFISDHELPNDVKFFHEVQLGMAPAWGDIRNIPRIKSIVKMSKTDYSTFADSGAVIYPLHDVDNSLTSFRMRAIEKKEIRTLKPHEGAVGFYGRSLLKADKSAGDVILVEGENNLLALASMFYGTKDFSNQLSIVSVGPSSGEERIMYALARLGSVFYLINDNDAAGEKIVYSFYKYGSQVMQVANWPSGTPNKYDIEDHLRGKPDKLKAYNDISPFLSFPEWVLKKLEVLYDREQNEKVKVRKIVETSEELLQMFKTQLDKDEFIKLVSSKFKLDVSAHQHNIKTTDEGFSISGHKYTHKDPADDASPPRDVSNFIFDVHSQLVMTTSDDPYSVTRELEGDVIRANGDKYAAKIPVDFLVEYQKIISSLRNAAGYDLIVNAKYSGSLSRIIQELTNPKDVYVFNVVGSPLEDLKKVKDMYGTEHVIVYPVVSVIGKEVVYNRDVNFKVIKNTLTKNLRFGNPDRSEQKKLIKTFLNKMMTGLYDDDPAVWMVMGYSIFSVAKSHISGYPLLNGSMMIVHGRTGNMKSTVVRLAQSFWGSYAEEGDLGQFVDTSNAQRYILSHFSNLTFSYDEFKPEGTSKDLDLGELIHQIASGRDKMRLRSEITLREPRSINCSVMMTTEQLPDLSSSQNARSIPIRMPEIKKSALYPEVDKWAFDNQHRLTAPIAAWVNQVPDKVRKSFDSMYKEMKDGLKQFSNAERLSSIYSKCLTGVWILTEYAQRLGVINEDRRDEIIGKTLEYAKEAKSDHVNRIEGTAVVDRIVMAIQELVQQGSIGVAFIDLDGNNRMWIKPKNQVVGIAFWQKGGIVTMAFHETNLVNHMNKYRPMSGLSVESMRIELFESRLIASSSPPNSTSYYWPDTLSYIKGRVRKIDVSEKMPDLAMYILGSFMAKI